MEHQKILHLLNKENNSTFVTRKQNIVNDQLNVNYDVGNEIICFTEVLKSDLCAFNDAYILVKVVFKNCAPFIKCITKIDGTTIDDAEDLVMPMYNVIEYSSHYSETTGSLVFYLKDEPTNFNADITSNKKVNSFEYKAKLLGSTGADGNNGILKNATIAVPLKYLSNFWRSLRMSLINCKIEWKFKWITPNVID